LAALENRIKELEWTLGIDAGQTTTSSLFPLLKKLEELKLRVTILTPELIGRINKRLQESSREINSARSDASHDSLSMIREDKSSGLGEMHELIKRWDARCSELPNIVSHLVASRQLHEDGKLYHFQTFLFISL
jgi:hypothetical protein